MRAIEEIDTKEKKDIIINQMMMSNSVYILVSSPKVGKSMLALQLSNSIINGIPFLEYQVIPSPILYISTESYFGQIKERINFMNLKPKQDSLFIIDRNGKTNISIEYLDKEIQKFSNDKNGKLIIIDMLKDIDFGVIYDINNYQDVSQKVMPKLRNICDKYNVSILLTHHLNKSGSVLGSTGIEAVVDGIIKLIPNRTNKNIVKLEMLSRDFPSLDIQLKKDNNLIFSVSKTNYDEEDIPYELIQFIKYASENKDFRFTCTEIVSNAKILISPKRFGRLLNNNIELLKNEGVIITKDRQSDNRYYYCHYEEPTEEEI